MPKTIRTERLVLRPVSTDDADAMMEFANDPEWGRYQQVPQPYRREDAEEFLGHFARLPGVAAPVPERASHSVRYTADTVVSAELR